MHISGSQPSLSGILDCIALAPSGWGWILEIALESRYSADNYFVARLDCVHASLARKQCKECHAGNGMNGDWRWSFSPLETPSPPTIYTAAHCWCQSLTNAIGCAFCATRCDYLASRAVVGQTLFPAANSYRRRTVFPLLPKAIGILLTVWCHASRNPAEL